MFPEGRLCSLRRALLLWLVPMFLIVGGLSAAFSYWSYAHMVREFMDDQMEQLAHSLADNKGQLMPPPTNEERVHKWGTYVVQVYALDGRLLQSTWPDGANVELQAAQGFADVRIDGTGWRVFTNAADTSTARVVQVLQSGKFRTHLAFERATAAIAPVLILLPLALLVLWGLSGAVSRAVRDIGDEAARQNAENITELSLERVPAELRPMVESFNSVLTRLRDAFAAKRRFVQDAAHELRTPLTALSLQLENLRRDLPPNACAQSFAQLEQGVKRAERLVDQLLKLSRHEGTGGEVTTSIDLHAQVHESISTLIALADQRGIDLGVAQGGAPGVVQLCCSPGDLRSALDNLIENALRYTPEGGVVDVRVVNEHGRAAIEVIDTGPGIPPELMERVFDRFFRVPGTSARGSGLGLAIAQAAAERCGLRVVLRNRTDRSGLVARLERAA
ncbi:hypothetical protein UC35_08255 [Ramlibacter tataouinensis]|uniref:histidine kinase n=1 Tax=Ramlibacter tataouinensis TaxID=94132 RepID=A0A127JZH4_9BURK|nr:hypothetical protein UC35_08255 [Ramlibacter tataouinensis]